MFIPQVRIIGGGLAGSEAAFRLANQGFRIELWEMRPTHSTEAHKTGQLAELVCSNSFKSLSLLTAPGILKAEMEMLGSLSLVAACESAIPAGEALAVDRERFSSFITGTLSRHPNIQIRREEYSALDSFAENIPTIIATGPLTSPTLAEALHKISGEQEFYFYDAISPIVETSSIDLSRAFLANRHDKPTRVPASDSANADGSANEVGDYINCPMNREEYEIFIAALRAAERVETKTFERIKHFEGCMPIEAMVDRGPETLRFGPMRPIGLIDPRTGRRPWAVVQLRPENREKTAYNIVGFQTRMKYGEQKRVLALIPGLEKAEFLRFGSMHRNSFVHAPEVLAPNLSLQRAPNIFLAGQITGVEGYMESAAIGILAAIFVLDHIAGKPASLPPRATAMGALLSHLRNEASPDFQPMGINFGLFGESAYAQEFAEWKKNHPHVKKIPKNEKRALISQAALRNARSYCASIQMLDKCNA